MMNIPTDIAGKKVLGTARMKFVRSTKGTHLYAEIDEQGMEARVLCGSQYLLKSAIGEKAPMYVNLVVLAD